MVRLHAIENSEQFFQVERKDARIVDYSRGVVVGAKGYMPSRARRRQLRERSKFPEASKVWRSLNPRDKNPWKYVGRVTGRTDWQAFLKNATWTGDEEIAELGAADFGINNFGSQNSYVLITGASMVNIDISGNLGRVFFGNVNYGGSSLIVPDDDAILNSGNATRFLVDATNKAVVWTQNHPENYTIRRVRPGAGKVYENYEIHEQVILPLNTAISWASYFEPAGVAPSIDFVVTLEYDDAGTIKEYAYRTPLALSPGWSRTISSIDDFPFEILGYRVDLVFVDVLAMILIDRLRLRHSGANWAIDPECEDMELDIAEIHKNVLKPWSSPDDGLWTFAFSGLPDDVPLMMEE